MSECRIYEDVGLLELADGMIRPGGLALTERAVALSHLAPGSKVLDLGCGTGATIEYLIEDWGFRATGIDPSRVLLSEGRRRAAGLPLLRASGEHLPLADAVLDGVIAECSLSVTRDVEEVMNECWRVLRADGRILVSDVYARNPEGVPDVTGLPMECCPTGAVSRDEWVSRLETAGFEVMLWEDHSRAFKEFAARIILSYGSPETFWLCSRKNAGKEKIKESNFAVLKARPGYFLLIGRKK